MILMNFALMEGALNHGDLSRLLVFKLANEFNLSTTFLSCGIHKCPSKCHALYDHSKMKCKVPSSSRCADGHLLSFDCASGPPATCLKCSREAELAKKKKEEEMLANNRRDAEQREHLKKMDELEAQIAAAIRAKEDARLANERADALRQKQVDLDTILQSNHAPTANVPSPAITTSTILSQSPPSSSTILSQSPPPSSNSQHAPPPAFSAQDGRDPSHAPSSPLTNTLNASTPTEAKQPTKPKPPAKPFAPLAPSASKTEWDHRKALLGSTNKHVDAVMGMTGLEDIKKHILSLLDKIDVSKRQGASLKKERFNAVLLGNPGTGMTSSVCYFTSS